MNKGISLGDALRNARIAAAKDNPNLSTLAGAAEALDVSAPETVGRWERDECTPNNHNVKRMAVLYGAPELLPFYCATSCPVGKGRVCQLSVRPVEQVALRLYNSSRDLTDDIASLMRIAEDGMIDDDERPRFDEAVKRISTLKTSIDELMLASERAGWFR